MRTCFSLLLALAFTPVLWAQGIPNRSFDLNATKAPYLLAPGDMLKLEVRNLPDLKSPQRIAKDGNIQLPLVGSLQVEGLTTAQIKARLLELYRPYIKDLKVLVSLATPRSIYVTVMGEVAQPGSYRPPSAIPKNFRLSQVLQLAGGLSPSADITHIALVRLDNGEKEGLTVNLWPLLKTGETQADVVLKDGDLVMVPRLLSQPQDFDPDVVARSTLGSSAIRVNILGAVKHPGSLRIPPETNLRQALTAVGEVTEQAAGIMLLRKMLDEQFQVRVFALPLVDNPSLQAGDVVIISHIPTSTEKSSPQILKELLPVIQSLTLGQ